MLTLLLFKLYLQLGIGTVFSSHDKFNPNPHLACAPNKVLKDSDLVIAHRELPCFSRVIICNPRTSLCTKATTLDKGPFGINNSQYTSVVDMSEGVQKAIGHNGFEPVVIGSTVPIPNKAPKKKYVRKDS